MINNVNTYTKLNTLSNRIKYNITKMLCPILDWLSINYIEMILTKPYALTFELEHKLIDLISKIKNHGGN